MNISIRIEDPILLDITQLLQAHLEYAASHTPKCSGHALNIEALRIPEITFWSARSEGELVGCVALKELDTRHGEIKSMHTASAFRRRGIGKALLEKMFEESRNRGYDYLSLETGKSEDFKASRLLYAKMGFQPCEPFGDYKRDLFSYCMTKNLTISP